MPNENVGGIQAEATIDTSKAEQSAKQLGKTLDGLNPAMQKAEQGLNKVEKAGAGAATGIDKVSKAGEALNVALGVAGVNSIQSVITKMQAMGKESLQLAITLEGVESRAKAIFGEAFPQVSAATDRVAAAAKRSSSDVLQMATGFGVLLDSAGATQRQVQTFSVELSKLTVALGKAHPDLSDADIYSRIEAAILGNVRGLRQLGVVMNDKALADFAERKNIKLKISDMTDEQAMVLRSQFLMEETTKLQAAAADSTGNLGDTAKTAAAKWHDLLEALGTNIGPFISAANTAMVDMLTNWMKWIGQVKNGFLDIFTLEVTAQKRALDSSLSLTEQNVQFQQERGIGMGKAKPKVQPEASAEADFWKNRSAGGGSGKSDAEKALDVEKKINDAMNQRAKMQLDLVRNRRDDLLLLQKLGVLTDDEGRELNLINRRLEFQKDRIADATREYEKQKEALDKVEDKIGDINDKIVEERKRLADTLAGIDKDATQARSDKMVDLIKEMRDVEKKLANGEGNQVELTNRKREIDQLLDPFRLTAEGRAQLGEADKTAGLNDFQLIDAQAEKKKQDARAESDARIAGLQEELAQAQKNREQLVKLEQDKKQAVLDAMQQRTDGQAAAFAKSIADTETFVQTQIEQFNRLAAAIKRTPGVAPGGLPARAAGGPIFGPGTETSDSILARLSHNEHVFTAADVRAMGGHAAVLAFRNSLHRDLPRFAQGGAVSTTHDNSRTVHVTNNNYGEMARFGASGPGTVWFVKANLR